MAEGAGPSLREGGFAALRRIRTEGPARLFLEDALSLDLRCWCWRSFVVPCTVSPLLVLVPPLHSCCLLGGGQGSDHLLLVWELERPPPGGIWVPATSLLGLSPSLGYPVLSVGGGMFWVGKVTSRSLGFSRGFC